MMEWKYKKKRNKTHTQTTKNTVITPSIHLDKNLQRKIHVHPISFPSNIHVPTSNLFYLDPLRILDLFFLRTIALNLWKSVRLALLVLATRFFAHEVFAHLASTSCSFQAASSFPVLMDRLMSILMSVSEILLKLIFC